MPWIEDVDENDEDDPFLGYTWGERKQWFAEQCREERKREERESRVQFEASAVQWAERQRQGQEDFEKRFAAVCGKGYDGEGPKIVDEAVGATVKQTISDSGTNIDVISYKTAQHLHKCGLRFYKCREDEPRQYVVFGVASARVPVIGFMYGNGLLDKVAVVNEVAANLISVTAFTKRGMLVTYSDRQVEIKRANDNEVVFVGPFDEKTGLYHLDLIHLMLAPGLGDRRGTTQASSFAGATVRRGAEVLITEEEAMDDGEEMEAGEAQTRFKKSALLRGRRFHANLEHIPYSTIADNIESGVWRGLHPDLTPALFRELARRKDCMICGVGRLNEEHGEGSGDREYPVGHTVALDYQGKISPTSKNGETGEFVLLDVGSGMTKRYGEQGDKTSVEDALKEWCSYMLSFGHVVKEARHDSGSVEIGQKFRDAARKLGINPIPTPPGKPEMRIERRIQTHKNDIASIIARTPLLGASDWDIASSHACLIRSTMPCAASKLKGDGSKSPYELVTGHLPRIEVFEKYGLGDIGVVKKAVANRPGYGGTKNEAVQIIGMEVGDVKAVRVEFVGTKKKARRGNVQKLFLQATEELNEEEQATRKASYTDNIADGSVTFAVEGGRDVVVESVQQLAAQELELARRGTDEEFDTIARRMQQRREDKATEGAAATEAVKELERQEKAEEAVQNEPDNWWYDWTKVANMAFWAAHLEAHGMPTEEYARQIFAFTASTGVEFEMDLDNETAESGTAAIGDAFAAKARLVHGNSNPTKTLIRDDETLAEMWRPSMVKERGGINVTSHEVAKEYALKFGVTRHVTVRGTKRDGTLKTRFAIDGRQEIRQGKFPNRDALYSPAMDEELLRLSLQYAASLDMDMGKSDVVQCFTHNPMETARFKRKLIVFMDEYESGVPGGQYREFDSVSYGTADASSEWYINMSREMMSARPGMGFSKSVHHPCLFFKGSVATEDLITVSVATDDMLRLNLKTNKARQSMADFKAALDKKWPVTHQDGDDFTEILGVVLERGQGGEIRCTQPSEMKKIREAFFGDAAVPEVLVPLHPELETAGNEHGGIFDDDDNSEEARAERSTPYRSLLGKLSYIRITRLDVLHTLSVLAERAHRPSRRDMHGLYWLAAYLLTTEHVPLVFHPVDIEEALNENGVFRWTLFGDCSWASRARSASCVAQMVVHGDLRTEEQRMRKPFTAPVIAKTGKQRGPAADSASAGEMSASVAVIKSGMAIRGISEELAGVAIPHSLERMPEGAADASPLCTDNASNGMTISSQTGKKAKGMRLLAREIEFIKFHVEEGSVEVIVVPGKEQRANPLTKAIRSASVHFREAEWLLGTSPELAAMQGLAEERGRSKRSLRPEVVAVAGFAGYGRVSGSSRSDTEWAERATDQRETGMRDDDEERAVVRRNTLANAAPEGGRSHQIAALLQERREPLREAKQRNMSARWAERPNHGNTTKFAANCYTPQELATLIFRLDEWMQPAQEFAPLEVLFTLGK